MKNIISFGFAIFTFCLYGCSSTTTKSNASADSSASHSPAVMLEQKTIHLCTEILPPPPPKMNIQHRMDTLYYKRTDGSNDTQISTSLVVTKRYIASLKQYKWRKKNLTVSFYDGDSIVKSRIMNTAKQWESYCGIKFNFTPTITESTDITISLQQGGSWSAIGNDSKFNRPSMNFGWLSPDDDQEEYDQVVLHEFGHALGLVHEHQSPNTPYIPWDSTKVYAYYKSTQKPPWSKGMVDSNIFMKYNKEEVNATAFDSNSIMIYAIPAELTKNGAFSIGEKDKLSDADIAFIGKMYPKRK